MGKTATVNVRLTVVQLREIDAAARVAGQTRSEIIRDGGVEAARALLRRAATSASASGAGRAAVARLYANPEALP